MFHTLQFLLIVVSSSDVLFAGCMCVYQAFNFYLKMTRTKKFASKPKFRGHKYIRINKNTGVSERRQRLSDQSGDSSCVKHSLTASNKKIQGTSVNTENKVSENNFCKSESNFTHDASVVG
jgi:hypothetical protein